MNIWHEEPVWPSLQAARWFVLSSVTDLARVFLLRLQLPKHVLELVEVNFEHVA